MFDNYIDIPEGYIPNNIEMKYNHQCKPQKLKIMSVNGLYEVYNVRGELLGYKWHCGDTPSLNFAIVGDFYTNPATLYSIGGYTQTLPTEEETKTSAEDYVKDSTIRIRILNFRMEEIFSTSVDGAVKFNFTVDSELAQKLVKGIYYLDIDLIKGEIINTIFSDEDCTITVL